MLLPNDNLTIKMSLASYQKNYMERSTSQLLRLQRQCPNQQQIILFVIYLYEQSDAVLYQQSLTFKVYFSMCTLSPWIEDLTSLLPKSRELMTRFVSRHFILITACCAV